MSTDNQEPQLYYLLSLKYTLPRNNVLTWWGKDRCGYCWDLEKAGKYTEQEAKKLVGDGETTVMVPCEKAEAQAKRVVMYDWVYFQRLGVDLAQVQGIEING